MQPNAHFERGQIGKREVFGAEDKEGIRLELRPHPPLDLGLFVPAVSPSWYRWAGMPW